MLNTKNQHEDINILGFQHIQEELKKGAFIIDTKVKANMYNTTREALLKQNFKISMLLNEFLKKQNESYVNDYITSIEQLRSNITNSNFQHIMQSSDRNVQEQIIQQVEDDFNEFLKKYAEDNKSRQKLQEELDQNLGELFLKAEQILTDTELQMKNIISTDLISRWNKLGLSYSLPSSNAYKKLMSEFKDKPEQLNFIIGLLRRAIK